MQTTFRKKSTLKKRSLTDLVASRRKPVVTRPYSRSGVLGNRTLVVSRNLRSNSYLPNRMECVMCTVGDFYWATSAMTAAAGNYFNLFINSYQPLSGNGYQITTGTGTATYASNATAVQGTLTTNKPIGWTNYSALYDNYRVKKYRIEITVLPASAADSSRLIMFSLGNEAIPSSAAGNVNTRVMEAQPGARAVTCSAYDGAGSRSTIVWTGYPHRDLGKTYADYMGAADTACSTSPTADIQDYIGIYLQQLNGSNNGAPVTMQIRVTQDIVFYDLIQEIN